MSSGEPVPRRPGGEGEQQDGAHSSGSGSGAGHDASPVPAGAHPGAAHRRTGGVPPPWTRGSAPCGQEGASGPDGADDSGGAGDLGRTGGSAGSAWPPPAAPGPGGIDGTDWRRLPALMLVVGPATALLKLAPALIVLLIFGAGRGNTMQVWIAAGIAVLAVGAGVIRWRTTRYRITPDRVELHSGLLFRQRRSVPRDRVRTVDLTAPLLHRLVGVSVVKVGSGQSAGKESGLDLDAVTTAEAERLRRELLARPTITDAAGTGIAGGGATAPPTAVAEPDPGEELDRIDWASLRYAPLTVSSLAAVGAVAGAGWNLLNEADVDPRTLPGADAVATAPVWAAVLAGVLVLLVLMVAGSIVLFVERWWGFRLTREPDGTLRVRRGLLTRRSLSVSEQRLRGVTVSEPLLVRALGRGAQAGALTVGLAGADGEAAHAGALGPPVPRAHAHHIAATAARAGADITSGPLTAHPRVARTRRLVRAVGPALVLPVATGVLAYLGGPSWPIAVAVLLLVAAVPLGLDRYRALGHRLDERYLVARQGSLLRTTSALRRDGVIGWRVRQSVFQRRAGVVTLEATTAAGTGAVQILDLSPADAVALMAEVTPAAVGGFREVSAGDGSRTGSG
ncbi:PH domain-containing protein [Pseudonocardia parietis]|uniref:Membrane protein n=1 Tax=Pseudonocardia parietis TaxID=570936 RepID=A0ABS4W2K0_9PSEU|nr:PH domain-containing protein [Pseudonocardia parietis]MBP2370338.1 putative membrane protein [Pseudonocardia parietis]